MGFLTSNSWQPNWIGSEDRTQLVRKEFTLSKPIKRAWVYASALGIYELRFNGQKVSDDLFAPGWTDYRARVQCQRYDITGLVQQGGNAIGAVLAPGCFAGNLGWFNKNRYGSQMRLAAQLHVEFTDGTTQVVASDSTWKAVAGPLTDSDIQGGASERLRLDWFSFIPVPPPAPVGQKIGLQVFANSLFVSENADLGIDCPLVANETSVGARERFTVFDTGGGQIALLANANGKYVCADTTSAAYPLQANQDSIGNCGKFEWITAHIP